MLKENRKKYHHGDLKHALIEAGRTRLRPILMTASTVFVGLLPIMLNEGTGSEVMRRVAAPMVGGMITAPLLSLFVMPALYLMWKRRSGDVIGKVP